MRNILFFCSVMIIISIASCTKDELASPQLEQSNMPVAFSSFTALSQSGKVTIHFTASHENNVQYFKIFSGDNGSQLCMVAQLTTQTGTGSHSYSFEDLHPKGNPTYYMIGYVSNDNSLKFDDQMLTVNVKQ